MKKFLVKCTFEGEACQHVVMAENAHAAGEEAWRIHEESWKEWECDPDELPFQIDDVEDISTPVSDAMRRAVQSIHRYLKGAGKEEK